MGKNGNIEPVMYEGKTTAEIISGLTCNCKGKKRCKVDCSCYVNSLPCIELCFCESDENKCHNPSSFSNEEIEEIDEDISKDSILALILYYQLVFINVLYVSVYIYIYIYIYI